MTNGVENPKVKQSLERIESETMTAKQLMTLYNNTLKYKDICDLERELIVTDVMALADLQKNHQLLRRRLG